MSIRYMHRLFLTTFRFLYLSFIFSLFSKDESDTTFAVIGNESCDLDSACCSIALAHFLSVKNPDNPSVPLLNCHREDLPLRQDIIWLMQHIGIDHTQFVHYPEEFNPSEAKNLKVTLVDHNVPDEMLRPHTVEIIDHHEDAQTIQCPRVIEGVGSCATLVAERLLDDEEYEMTKDIATLLLSAILADTANLVAEGRTTDKDRFVASRLEGLVTVTPDELYNKVTLPGLCLLLMKCTFMVHILFTLA